MRAAPVDCPAQGYVAEVSDGRCVYSAPFRNTNNFCGILLRIDSRLPSSIPPTATGGSNL
jgi:hypothetical protein